MQNVVSSMWKIHVRYTIDLVGRNPCQVSLPGEHFVDENIVVDILCLFPYVHQWIVALPAEWTIFMPLNSRTTSLHDREVAQNNVNEENGEGNSSDT